MQVLWLRNNLRVHDNPALISALRAGGPILALYVWDPRVDRTTRYGFPSIGDHRRQFLLQALDDLPFPVHQAVGPTEEILAELGTVQVYFQHDAAPYEQEIERAVIRKVRAAGGSTKSFEGISLIHPDDLTFPLDRLPETFTEFRRIVERQLVIREPFGAPNLGEAEFVRESPVRGPEAVPRPQSSHFVGGESRALARLKHYLWTADRLRVYKETRNGMLNLDDSSKFSPWLACGSLSPRKIYAEVRRYEQERVANDSTYWLIFELLWRDYFQFWMRRHGAQTFRRAGVHRFDLPWVQDADLFRAWQSGQTGYPIVDANMRELAATGYLSNRGRQIVASFLTKNLGLDWRMGAEWFESQLLDYDPASNYGNWQYAAGIGADARGFRLFHYRKQAQNYDPSGDHVRAWIPELRHLKGMAAHEPWTLRPDQRNGYPDRVVDFEESARESERHYRRVTGWSPSPSGGKPQSRPGRYRGNR